MTPSVVAFTPQGTVVGEAALDQASSNVMNTLHSVKRFMGRSPKQTAQDAATVGFPVVARGDRVAFACPALESPLSPEEVSAAVLVQLISEAEQELGTPIRSAVITVPAYFDTHQRSATLAAAALAGLDRTHLLSEPVAACLAYGVSGGCGKVLVFDLGAGTFDVSVVSISGNGEVVVVATSGDSHLGGDDFDAILTVRRLATCGGACGASRACHHHCQRLRAGVAAVGGGGGGARLALQSQCGQTGCRACQGSTLSAQGSEGRAAVLRVGTGTGVSVHDQ